VSGVAALLCLLAPVDLDRLLKLVEDRYNRARTIQVQFQQSFTQQGRTRTESGELFLRKPGKMRWEYHTPAGKLFLSDGKNVYFYSPSANRVERSKLKESEDYRAPLAFLLGKLNFKKDFREIRKEGEKIVAMPSTDRLPYRQVEFEATPDGELRRVTITGQDASVMRFEFTNERRNVPLNDTFFTFRAPFGAEIVEAAN